MKIEEAIKNFNEAYLGKDAIEEQWLAMEEVKLKYSGRDLECVVERLYTIHAMLPPF